MVARNQTSAFLVLRKAEQGSNRGAKYRWEDGIASLLENPYVFYEAGGHNFGVSQVRVVHEIPKRLTIDKVIT